MASGSGGGIKLPERSTRGKRMRAAMAEEEDEADTQFWNQEFFAEEEQDEDYEEEVVSEDVPDSDFDEPEEVDDDEDGQDVEEKPRRKALKAPEPKAAPKPKPAKPAEPKEPAEPKPKRAAVEAKEPEPEIVFAAPTLRRSTMARVAEAEKQRQVQAKTVVKPKPKGNEWRPLTQAELLAEAARTEIDNTYSLRWLLAMEEETKKKAQVVKQQYKGPLVRLASRRHPVTPAPGQPEVPAQQPAAPPPEPGAEQPAQPADDAGSSGAGGGKQEQEVAKSQQQWEASLVYELHNMPYPPLWLRRHRLPPAPPPPLCMITGAPAKYRDPATGVAYSNALAYRRLKGLPPLPHQRAAPAPPVPLPLTAGKFNTSACAFPGAASRQVVGDAAKRALAALPPEPGQLPPPSADFPAVQPTSLPPPLMALVLDVANGVTTYA